MTIGGTGTFGGKDRGQTAADKFQHLTATIRAVSGRGDGGRARSIALQRTSRSCRARPYNRLVIGRSAAIARPARTMMRFLQTQHIARATFPLASPLGANCAVRKPRCHRRHRTVKITGKGRAWPIRASIRAIAWAVLLSLTGLTSHSQAAQLRTTMWAGIPLDEPIIIRLNDLVLKIPAGSDD